MQVTGIERQTLEERIESRSLFAACGSLQCSGFLDDA